MDQLDQLDQVDVYRDKAGEWRWRRVAPNQQIIADSAEGYVHVEDCYAMARRVNAQPYTLTLHGDTVDTVTDLTGQMGEAQ